MKAKKLFCLGLAGVIICSNLTQMPIHAQETTNKEMQTEEADYAESRSTDEDGFEIENGALVGYSGTATEIVIPDGVTKIGEYAFYECSSLTSITIPDGVTTIGSLAFSCCSSLTSITIPESVTTIEYSAFSDCTSLTNINILEGAKTIEEYAFAGCSSLTSITIPGSVTMIADAAFENCSNLAEINVSENNGNYASADGCLYNKDMTAFLICPMAKEEVTIPESVTEIEDYIFSGCKVLTEINVSENNSNYASADGCLYNKNMTAFFVCPGAKEKVTILGSVTKIEKNAFSNCSGLTSINIPEGVTEIGEYAFFGCSSLTSINIPEGVTEIREYAFFDCSSLISINIPEGVTEIEDEAFFGSSSLTSITIPESVTSIGNGAFLSCSGLTSINIPEGVTTIGWGAFGGCSNDLTLFVTAGSYAETYAQENNLNYAYENGGSNTNGFEIEDGVLVGYSGTATEIVIPEGVTEIGEYAFYKCSSLTGITISESVTVIGEGAFEGCSGLTNINLSNSVIKIEADAFRGCSSLTSITIPGSVTEIGEGAFAGCSDLTNINLLNGVAEIGEKAFYKCSSLTGITIPESVTEIGYEAFYGCSSLTEINVSENNSNYASADGCLYNKDMTAFLICPMAKEEVTIPESVTEIVQGAFGECRNLMEINVSENNTNYASVDGCLYNKGKTEFLVCPGAKEEVTIPERVERISDSAFWGYHVLKEINVSANNNYYASADGCLYNKDMTEFRVCPNAKEEVIIPEGVTAIRTAAFRERSSLTSVSIPGSVTEIGSDAFEGCSSLTSISIPENVTRIEYCVFGNCSSLTSITLPESITVIEGNAFDCCSSLASITIPESVITIGYNAFHGCESLTSITIPKSVTEIGHGAFSYCSSLTSITIPESVTKIGYDAFSLCSIDLTLIVTRDSYAETYAKENDISYRYSGEDVHTHSYTDKVTTQPGCTTKGIKTYTCAGCGDSYTEEIAATGHKAVKDAAVAATCTQAGKTEGSHCSVCKAVIVKQNVVAATGHKAVKDAAVAATCTQAGKTEGSHCSVCNAVIVKQNAVAATGHSYSTNTVAATTANNGRVTTACTKCGYKSADTVIYAIKTVKLSKDSFIFNGKSQKPSIVITDRNGKTLKDKKDYTVSYPKSIKKVGSYNVNIKLQGNYSGTIKETFTITPKPTLITKVIPDIKGFTIKWKKQANQTVGYEIVYSTDSKFKKGTKTVTVNKNKIVLKSISKLKAKKKYYVRIRTYKTVKGQTYYSDWSRAMTVATRNK